MILSQTLRQHGKNAMVTPTPAATLALDKVRKTKKAKKRHSMSSKTIPALLPSGPVVVNDPTIIPSVPKVTAHDIRHFFTKGKDGAKTVCNLCRSVV
jgi:hypothetical protein